MMRFGTILAVLALGGCGPSGNDPGPGGVTVDEARALDEAAEMLEQRRLPPEALSNPAVEGEATSAETPAPAPPAQ
ncbi:hypothetical protein U4960_02270 [Altererythrobacter sp. H2]|uniref:hypothetical protein n=1 Tax=Altererythrobacter sp. H2 TaxID=3108391 RepID=UPI000BCDDE3F|nr:hypothetical protein [Altererythrobacter sp. H2]OZA93481.1 MAG: hypothetical protein B7X57_04900 [Erythrobacter sp. 34-65-8]WRK96179.1 hypothetical protein U4960_02270 [Altererythrobacter sp. H2]